MNRKARACRDCGEALPANSSANRLRCVPCAAERKRKQRAASKRRSAKLRKVRPEARECESCGEVFKVSRFGPIPRDCVTCREILRGGNPQRRKREGPPKVYGARECVQCGRTFTLKRSNQKVCGEECRRQRERGRDRNRKRALRPRVPRVERPVERRARPQPEVKTDWEQVANRIAGSHGADAAVKFLEALRSVRAAREASGE